MSAFKIEGGRRTFLAYGLILFGLLFYLVSVLSRIRQPISEEDLNWLVAAQSLYTIGKPITYAHPYGLIVHCPHVYLYAIRFAFDLFGTHDWVARLPGILSGFLSLFLASSTIPGGNSLNSKMEMALRDLAGPGKAWYEKVMPFSLETSSRK